MTEKLDRRDRAHVIDDERFPLTGGAGAGFLAHDNVDQKTLEIYTLPGRGGEKVLNYTVEVREDVEWKLWLRVFADAEAVYLHYESGGDMVEAEDVNELQRAVSELDTALGRAERAVAEHEARRDNPHGVTKVDVGLGRADDTPDGDKPVSAAQLAAIQGSREEAAAAMAEHEARRDNPHQVDKDQVGLSHVEDVLQATKTEHDAHVGDGVHHLTQAERLTWGDKYTRAEVDNLLAGLVNDMDWKESVATLADISTAYPEPEDGWTVNVKDTNITYRYDGAAWVAISANAIPKATAAVDGLMTKEDKAALDGAVGDQHKHGNKGVLDGITSALVATWGTVTGKVDKAAGKGLSANDYTDAEKAKLAGLQPTDEQTPTFAQASARANLVSGEKLPVLLGKLMRWFADLKAVAWSGSYADLTGRPTSMTPTGHAASHRTGGSDALKAADVGADPAGAAQAVRDELEGHEGDTGNPHGVTAEQTGARPNSWVPGWGDVTGKPAAFPPVTHTHAKSEVGLGSVPNVGTNDQTPTFAQAAARANLVSGEKLSVLLGKLMRWFADLKAVAWSGSYNDLTDKPTGLPPGGTAGGDLEGSFPNPSVKDNSHNHTIANVTGLQAALDGKAAASHGVHVTYSTTAPVMDGAAAVGAAATVARSDHRHPVDTSRAAASHTHAMSGVTGLQAALDGKLSAGGLTWDDLKGGGGA